jgi:hypothetical protein
VCNPERSEGTLQHRRFEVDLSAEMRFFVELNTLWQDLVSDVGLHYA